MTDDDGIKKLSLPEFVASLTSEQCARLQADAQTKLAFWFDLARLRDETGLPIDIIYLNLRDKHNRLPIVYEKGVARPVTNAEFEDGMRLCIQIRQCGGLESVLNAIQACAAQQDGKAEGSL